jgi:hypothetical protein
LPVLGLEGGILDHIPPLAYYSGSVGPPRAAVRGAGPDVIAATTSSLSRSLRD